MFQRQACPSIGALRRPLAREACPLSNRNARSFYASSQRRATDGPSESGSAPNTEPRRETRRTRNAEGYQKVSGLQQQRSPPSGQNARQIRPTPSGPGVDSASRGAPRPLIRKQVYRGPDSPRQPRTAAPPGTMVRAPTNLRVALTARKPGARGPDLRGRDGPKSGGQGQGGPKRRLKGDSKASPSARPENAKLEDMLSDGMVQQLLRLQRKEWDRVPYEPKYVHGSAAALELVEAGKKLFEGEIPTVKTPSKLDRRLGIVGRHGI